MSVSQESGRSSFTDADYDGLAGSFAVKLGWSINPMFTVYGILGDFVLTDPSYETDDHSEDLDDETIAAVYWGLGLTVYPVSGVNAYASLAAGAAELSDSKHRVKKENGFAIRGDLGYEWWVSANWGLGVALTYQYAGTSYDKLDVDSDSQFIGILFSATFN